MTNNFFWQNFVVSLLFIWKTFWFKILFTTKVLLANIFWWPEFCCWLKQTKLVTKPPAERIAPNALENVIQAPNVKENVIQIWFDYILFVQKRSSDIVCNRFEINMLSGCKVYLLGFNNISSSSASWDKSLVPKVFNSEKLRFLL